MLTVPMAPTSNNNTPDPKPTGDLEQLFRQKFAEVEVAPRASLWDQLDHELLVQQNETYRRRLLLHRWVAAACLLLMAGGGTWFSLQPNQPTGAARPQIAAASAPGNATEASRSSAAPDAYSNDAQAGLAASGLAAASAAGNATTASEEYYFYSAPSSARRAAARMLAERSGIMANPAAVAYRESSNGLQERSLGVGRDAQNSQLGSALLQDGFAAMSTASGDVRLAARNAGQALPAYPAAQPLSYAALSRPEKLPLNTELTASKATADAGAEETPTETLPVKPRRWKFNAAYAATAYNPNANFSHNGSGLKVYSAQVRNSTDAYEAAAAEYRQNLQAGLGQRLAVAATYALSNNWDVQAGLEAGEQRASSASSWNFLDGKSATADYYSASAPPLVNAPAAIYQPKLRTVNYRYRTASLPVNVRYNSSSKRAVSLYAKLGAAVNVLLSSCSELQGVPEATRVYNLSSSDSPYRKVTGSVRGGAGLRYQPGQSSWSVALGPDLEAGFTSLNAQPAQSFTRQSRPYAIGVEASVQFGSPRVATPIN